MEIKLKQNSNIIIKNHSGDTLCSIDEATGKIVNNGVYVATTDQVAIVYVTLTRTLSGEVMQKIKTGNVVTTTDITHSSVTIKAGSIIFNAQDFGTFFQALVLSGNHIYQIECFTGGNWNIRNGGIRFSDGKLSTDYLNGKNIPTYPTDTTKQYKFVQKVGGALDYVEDIDSTTEITTSDVFASLPTGLVCRVSDSRITRQNKEVKLTMRLAIQNETPLSISVGNSNSFTINISNIYSSRIRDMKGVLLNATGESGVGITASICYSDNGDSQFYYINQPLAIKRASTNANQLQLQIRGMSSIAPQVTHNFIINVSFPLVD